MELIKRYKRKFGLGRRNSRSLRNDNVDPTDSIDTNVSTSNEVNLDNSSVNNAENDLSDLDVIDDLSDINDSHVPLGVFDNLEAPEDRINALFASFDSEFYLNQYGEYTVFLYYDDDSFQAYKIKGSSFETFIRALYHETYEEYLSNKDFKKFLDGVTSQAIACNDKVDQYLRYHSNGSSNDLIVSIDTCDEDNSVIRINSEGWGFIDPCPFFMNFSSQKDIEASESNNLAQIFDYIPIVENERILFLTYLSVNLINSISKPSLLLNSENEPLSVQSLNFIKQIIDPSKREFFSLDDTPTKRLTSARENYWLCYNNFDGHFTNKKKSFLMSLITGLTDNFNKQTVSFKRNVGINNEDKLPNEFLSKFLCFNLVNENLGGELELQASFTDNLPSIRGALYQLLSRAIALYNDDVELIVPNTTYIDFSRWTHAVVLAYVDIYSDTENIIDYNDGLLATNALSNYQNAFMDKIEDLHQNRNSASTNTKTIQLLNIIVRFVNHQDSYMWSNNYENTLAALHDFFVLHGLNTSVFPKSSISLGNYMGNRSNIEYLRSRGIDVHLDRNSPCGQTRMIHFRSIR